MTVFPEFPEDDYDFSAGEVAKALGGLIQRDSNGAPIPGVLGPTTNLGEAVPSSWRVQVNPFAYVAEDDGGIKLSGVSAAEQVDIEPATEIPSGQARIDRVCWDPVNASLEVVEGAPAASPSLPGVGVLAPLLRVRVNAGDGTVIASRVSVDADSTWLVSQVPRVASGRVSKRNTPVGGVVRVNVSFPAGRFTSAPNVQVSQWGDIRDGEVAVETVSTSGFTLVLGNNSHVRRSFGAYWRAEQL